MGLCKCPKRRVTNLFCFVHRVNVCEDCMVTSHPTCVVQSYLKWLEDSDYDAVCVLCSNSLNQGAVVRLLCYDVVHQSCLDKYGRSLPPTTTPAGYTCPRCKECLLPQSNMASPVAQQLRAVLQQFSWALSLLGEVSPSPLLASSHSLASHHQSSSHSQSSTEVDLIDGSSSEAVASLWGKPPPVRHHSQQDYEAVAIADVDDNKYKRKSPLTMLSKWARNHQLAMDGGGNLLRRYLMLALFCVLVVVTMIVLLTRVGRGMANRDPSLDWRHNPNLRTGD